MTDTESKVLDVESVVTETNAITVPDPVRLALVKDLGPIANRLTVYEDAARSLVVTNEQEASVAAKVCDQIAEDVKAVKGHEVLCRITDGLHKLHRRWTGLRDEFLTPMEAARKTIKGKVIDWQESEREKAEAEERRLQAEADAKARAEQDALLKKAAAAKKPETQERYQQQAAQVQAPTVRVESPKTGLKVTRVWVVKNVNEDMFFAAAAKDHSLRGYVTIDRVRMQRMKAANPNGELPGVEFVQQVR